MACPKRNLSISQLKDQNYRRNDMTSSKKKHGNKDKHIRIISNLSAKVLKAREAWSDVL